MDLKLKNNNSLSLFNRTEGYIPLPYVQTVGNVNIQLASSIDYSKTFVVEIVFEPISINEANCVLYGAYSGTTLQNAGCRAIFETSGSTTLNIRTANSGNVVANISGTTTIYHSKSSVKINNVSKSSTSYTSSGAYSFRILNGDMSVKIVSIKVTYNGSVIRNLVPAISPQLGHTGEYCLCDKQNSTYYYASSTGSFICNQAHPYAMLQHITTAYIKDCPLIGGVDILRTCPNLTRVRLDLGNVSGSLEELLSYSNLNGFNDDYEPQVKPKLVGTWTINSYHSIAEREAVTTMFDGLTVLSDSNYLVDDLIEQDVFAIQTLDPDKPNYNPAVAILFNSKGTITNKWHTLSIPLISGGGKWFITKSDASTITSIGTIFRGETTVTDTEGIVSSDTTAEYDFESFNELEYFGITAFLNGSSTTVLGAFGNCTKLREIKIPNSLTDIGIYTFYGCSNLLELHLPANITTVNTNSYGLDGCTKLSIFTSKSTINTSFINGTHASNSVCHIYKDLTRGTTVYVGFDKIYIYNDLKASTGSNSLFSSPTIKQVRIKRNVALNNNYLFYTTSTTYGCNITFLEVLGTIDKLLHTNPTNLAFAKRCIGTNSVIHLGKNSMHAQSTIIPSTYYNSLISKICVGDGSSKQNDEDVLALYTADSNWATYASKLSTWFDYHGVYKWYYITDVLTSCINTNPDAWPHITRGESYQTTIEAEDGYTLSSVTVTMYDSDSESSTYDTMVDITSSVYDSSTGEINIPSVTGNVVITAVAN